MRALPPHSCPGPREDLGITKIFPNQKCKITKWEWRMCWYHFIGLNKENFSLILCQTLKNHETKDVTSTHVCKSDFHCHSSLVPSPQSRAPLQPALHHEASWSRASNTTYSTMGYHGVGHHTTNSSTTSHCHGAGQNPTNFTTASYHHGAGHHSTNSSTMRHHANTTSGPVRLLRSARQT